MSEAPAPALAAPGRGNRYLAVLVFVVGAASLGSEIAAARLLAPFFGASTIVWANTIGVVLVALSVGYALGGRFADRHPDQRGLCALLLGAATLLALVPFAARPFFRASVDALDSIAPGAFVGSLIGVLAMIAVPVMMLGAASPWAIRLVLSNVRESGTVAGRMFAISTAGSLLGTFLSALVLIPFLGTQRTFIFFAVALALVAAWGLGRRFALVPLALVGVGLIPVGTVKAADDGEVLHETETEHQYVRVVRQEDGDVALELNEGQAIHSLYRPGSYLTDDVWDGYLVLPFATLERAPRRIAILGNGAGTTARAYGHFFPRTRIDGVELDAELTELGRRYFDLRNPRLEAHSGDARPWLERTNERFDVIMVDAYRQPYIPFYLATEEFFELVRDRLSPGGQVIVNVGHPEGNDDLEKVLARTMSEVFPSVRRWPKEDTNTLLAASAAGVSASRLESAIGRLPNELRPLAAEAAAGLGARLPGGEVYTDDRAPVEWLIDRSILGYAADN